MSDTTELENRIEAALDRIAFRVDKIKTTTDAPVVAEAGPDQSDRIAELTAALDEERQANAQLKARIETLKSQAAASAVPAIDVDALEQAHAAKLAKMDGQIQKLRGVNDQLRANNAKMRDAIKDGIAEPHLINKSMLTELEALRATRGADKAELDAIIDELKPLIEEGA